MEFYEGERVVTVRRGVDYEKGWTGTIKRSSQSVPKLILDNGVSGSLGWFIPATDLELIEERDPYEVDE